MNNFLIPANSKRSMLIASMFRKIDLVIFGSGLGLTIILMLVNSPKNLFDIGLDLLPLLITAFMVIPIPNQMNIWSFTANVYSFLTHQRNYKWRGWCKNYGEEESK